MKSHREVGLKFPKQESKAFKMANDILQEQMNKVAALGTAPTQTQSDMQSKGSKSKSNK